MSQSTSGKLKLAGVALVAAIGLCSFTIKQKRVETKETATIAGNWEEYDKVREYVHKNICDPIRKAEGTGKVKGSEFSRCPSGYQPRLAGPTDSVKTSRFVTGKVTLYKGCSGEYVCDFKVCVDQNFAVVKSKGMSDYVEVHEWLQSRSTKTMPVVKENAGEIKG